MSGRLKAQKGSGGGEGRPEEPRNGEGVWNARGG